MSLCAGGSRVQSDRSVQQKSSPNIVGEDFTLNLATPIYGEGAGDVVRLMLVSVFDSVAGAGDSFTTVVLVSFFSAGGLVTVVSFCSQAASNAAPAKMQMYFFIRQLDVRLG